jgi:hypothetical protein
MATPAYPSPRGTTVLTVAELRIRYELERAVADAQQETAHDRHTCERRSIRARELLLPVRRICPRWPRRHRLRSPACRGDQGHLPGSEVRRRTGGRR